MGELRNAYKYFVGKPKRNRLLGFNAVQFRKSLIFRRKISLPFSGWTSEPSKKPSEVGGELRVKIQSTIIL
jgi:hypothetical protein